MNKVRHSLATLWPSARISLVLTLISSSLILFADLMGIAPNQTKFELENRKQLSESFAILFSTMASEQDIKQTRKVLSKIVIRDDQLLSAGFRLHSGELLFEVGSHAQHWGNYQENKSTTTHVLVPIYRGNKKLGAVELRFVALSIEQGLGLYNNKLYRLILFMLTFGFLAFLLFMLRTLRQIDPSSVIPDRVNAAFDTLAEGVVILDDKEQIVLVNSAFSEIVQRPTQAMLGLKLSELEWNPTEDAGDIIHPWVLALASNESRIGDKLTLKVASNNTRTMVINSAPIQDHQHKPQGMLITFDDVTEIELQKQQLQVMVSDLEMSKKEIQRQNNELHFLATRDPLTGSLNRRSFYEQFSLLFDEASEKNSDLCCIMVDIDHFKRVNDNYGHAVGDEVIKLLANILESTTREEDIVGRYGGEEFCVILPNIEISEAIAVAERMRLKIKNESATQFPEGPRVTASLGVATIFDHAKDPSELNEQADQALYIAKESGRNRVIRWFKEDETKTQPQEISLEKNEDIQPSKIPISDNSSSTEEVLLLQTQIKQLENVAANFAEQLQHEQYYDNLTGLPNQAFFFERIKQSIEKCDRNGQLAAILIIDFDLFELINDNFGSHDAEEVYMSLSKKLSGVFRKTDSLTFINSNEDNLTVSRLERDEFGVLISDFNDRMVVPWVIKRIVDSMNQTFVFKDKPLKISGKIGISLYPEDASSPEELVSHAFTAKSFAKKNANSNDYQFFDPELQKASRKQIQLEIEILRAIKNEEWLLYYQPKMDIATGRINGVEALIRWHHPARGILGPFEFIDLAEQRGLIVEIGEWVLRSACRQAKKWASQGFNIKIAVNLSAVQLCQENFSNLILEIINESQIAHSQLELEVTETTLMDNFDSALNTLNRLRCSGINISIDDFGTGYSSLGYLKHLPINTLKIDRLFIKDIMTDMHDKNIVESVISMAHGLNLMVIAEGVETQEQFDLLKELSCDQIQGYLLSKPVEAEAVTGLLLKNKASN